MHLLWILAQAAPAPSGTPAAPTIPVDEGSFGLAVVVAALLTILVLVVVCSPIRRD